jgi:hypothetical protein
MLLGRGRKLRSLHNSHLSEVVGGVSGTLTDRRRGKFGSQFHLSFIAGRYRSAFCANSPYEPSMRIGPRREQGRHHSMRLPSFLPILAHAAGAARDPRQCQRVAWVAAPVGFPYTSEDELCDCNFLRWIEEFFPAPQGCKETLRCAPRAAQRLLTSDLEY